MTCKEKIDEIEKILDDEYETKIERIREVVDDSEDKEISLAKVKKAREEIAVYYENATNTKQKTAFNACLMVIDDLIAESEG